MKQEINLKLEEMERIYPSLSVIFRDMVPWEVLRNCIEDERFNDIIDVLIDKEFHKSNTDRINMQYAASILNASSVDRYWQLVMNPH